MKQTVYAFLQSKQKSQYSTKNIDGENGKQFDDMEEKIFDVGGVTSI